MNLRNNLSVLVAMSCVLWACTPEGSGDSQDVVVPDEVDAGVDMGGPQDLVADFCARSAQAECQWVFGCLNGSPQITTVFGFSGPMVADCAADREQKCLADLRDRESRGTVNPLNADAIDSCVGWLTDQAPCGQGDPADWVGQFRMAYDGFCTSVVRGNVQTSEPCQSKLSNKPESKSTR